MKDKTKKPDKQGKQEKPELDKPGLTVPQGNQHNQQRKRPGWPAQSKDQTKQT